MTTWYEMTLKRTSSQYPLDVCIKAVKDSLIDIDPMTYPVDQIKREDVESLTKQGWSYTTISFHYGNRRNGHFGNRFDKWLKANGLSWSRDFKPLLEDEIVRLHRQGLSVPEIWKRYYNKSAIETVNWIKTVIKRNSSQL